MLIICSENRGRFKVLDTDDWVIETISLNNLREAIKSGIVFENLDSSAIDFINVNTGITFTSIDYKTYVSNRVVMAVSPTLYLYGKTSVISNGDIEVMLYCDVDRCCVGYVKIGGATYRLRYSTIMSVNKKSVTHRNIGDVIYFGIVQDMFVVKFEHCELLFSDKRCTAEVYGDFRFIDCCYESVSLLRRECMFGG